MHPELHAVLTAIQARRLGQTPASELLVAVGDLVRRLGEQNLAERIASDAGAVVPAGAVSSLLDHLQWHTKDNGSEVHRTVERWLREGADERRVAIALGVEEFYPFLDPVEMKSVLANLSSRYPAMKARCVELVVSRSAAGAA